MASKVTCTCGWSWNKSDSSKKDMYVCHQCGKDNTMKNGGWLSKFDVPEAENGIEGTMGGLTDKGFNYNGAWGGTMAMGGSLPGSVGFTYARTQDPAPSKGKYAKKTMASAQNGQEMKFYQEGLDWKPKTISKDGSVIKEGDKPIKEKADYRKDNIYYGPTEFKECYGEGCSKQATKKVASLYGVDYDELNPQDAWYKKAAVIKGGGKSIYNKSQGDLAKSYENLKIGDFVSLDREGSPHAKDESRISGYDISDNEKTEHLGYVVGFNKEGVPLIRHGHEGNVLSNAKSYVQPITELSLPDLGLNYKVSSIYRPKKLLKDATLKTDKYYKEILPVENLEFFDKENVTKEKKKYLKAFNKNSKDFQIESGLSPEEVSAIGNISYGIFGNESSFNSNIKNKTIETPLGDFDIPIPTKNMFRVPKQMGKELLYNLGIADSSPSLGPTQLKYTDVKFNKDDTITDTGKLMDTLGTTRGGMGNYTTTNYDAVTKGTFANLANKYKQLKADPKFEFNPENNTVFGNVPIGYALARAWQNPSLSKLKETLQSNDSDYSKAVYKNMSELEGNVFPVNLPEVVVTPNKQKNGGWLNKYEEGGIIEDDLGQWAHPGEITKINSNQITMQGVDYPVLGISDTGDTQMMQPGQDYSYDGSSVTEYPMAQKGKKIQSKKTTLRYLMNDDDDLKSKSDATKVVKATAPNKVVGSPTRDQGTISVPYEKSIREKAISNLKQYDDPVRGLVTAPAVSALNLLRPDRYFENVNSESDIKDAFLNFGLDAAMVAPIAGEFSPYINKTLKSARQYLPEKGQFINEIKDLKRAIAPTQPTFINPAEQELLSTVRNVGIMSKTGTNDATVLEKILNKSAQLGEKEFESLVGSTRSQIKEKIQTIKASGSAKKPNVNTETTIASELGIDQDPDWLRIQERLRDRARLLSTPNYDEFGNIISESSTADIARAIQASGEIDLSTINSSQAQRARRIQELRDNSSNIVLRPIDELVDPPSYFTLDDMRYNENFDLSPEEMGLVDNMYFHRPTNKSLIRGLTERVNKNKYLPLVADDSDSLLPILYRDASNNPAVEMLKAYRTLESAPKGSTFKGASSLSTDSYPATIRLTTKALKNDIADVNYIGMGDLNFSGFSQIANVPKDVNLKEINTIIDQLNKKLPKPIPYAYEKDYKIIAPQITVTRKKNGGWLSKYN